MTNEDYGFFTKEEYEKLREEKEKRRKADMTREEAIEIFKLLRQQDTRVDADEYEEALQMAISALERIEGLEGASKQFMWERDIAISQLKELGYGFGQKIEPCEDAISREALLKKQYRIDDSATLSTRDVVNVEDIEDAPPVTPSRRKGHWIKTNSGYECSECAIESRSKSDFCQYCGAEMENSDVNA